MLLSKPLLCVCGKKPKLVKGDYNYVKYWCKCGLQTFHTRKEEFCCELWNSMINNISKLKVKI